MICVLDVTSGPARGRRFWIRTLQQMEIGRLSSADFAVPGDPHMSRRHMILEGTLSAFRVRDVGSANGTFVNNAKVMTVELCSGDRIRAGETTFEVSVLDDDDNPHAKDGLTFSSPTLPKMDGIAPSRSIESFVSPESETDEETTRRCTLPDRSRVGAFSRNDPRFVTVPFERDWWSKFPFHTTQVPGLLEESNDKESGRSLLPEMLKKIEAWYVCTAVVNVERLGRFGRQLLGILVERGIVTWHEPTVCTILDDRSREFRRMIESAVTLDALILLGSSSAMEPKWLAQLAAIASRPSVLNRLLRDPDSNELRALLSQAEFAIFEHDRQGRSSLFLGEIAGNPKEA